MDRDRIAGTRVGDALLERPHPQHERSDPERRRIGADRARISGGKAYSRICARLHDKAVRRRGSRNGRDVSCLLPSTLR